MRAVFRRAGIDAWTARKLAVAQEARVMTCKWITREKARRSTALPRPWLVRRFIDPEAQFLYVPADRVFSSGVEAQAIPYDIPGAEPFSHDGERCSFDAFINVFGLADAGLERLRDDIVRRRR